MAEIVRLTPEIDWENNDEFYPIDLRGAITVFGRTKRGRPVCITFTESGHDLQFDSGQIHNSFSLKVLKDIGGTNNIMESVGDGEPLLHYTGSLDALSGTTPRNGEIDLKIKPYENHVSGALR